MPVCVLFWVVVGGCDGFELCWPCTDPGAEDKAHIKLLAKI